MAKDAVERHLDNVFGQERPYKGREGVTSEIKTALEALLKTALFGDSKALVQGLYDKIVAREKHGIEKYGTTLETWNGRDPLQDVLEEELDRFQYLVQARKERADMLAEIKQLKADKRKLEDDLHKLTADFAELASTHPGHTTPSTHATPALVPANAETQHQGPPGAPNGPFVHALCTTGQVPDKRWGDIEDALRDIMLSSYANSALHGFWGQEAEDAIKQCQITGKAFAVIPEKLVLMHSELSEALEAYRDKANIDKMHGQDAWLYYESGKGKPEGYLSELADVFIRMGDLLASMKLEAMFVKAVRAKMAYNASRPHMHGKAC